VKVTVGVSVGVDVFVEVGVTVTVAVAVFVTVAVGVTVARNDIEGVAPPLSHMITATTPTANKMIANPPIKNGPVFWRLFL
jgi:hypothetical protein